MREELEEATPLNHLFENRIFQAVILTKHVLEPITPRKINMEPINHPFGKENHLNQTSIFGLCSSR